VSNALTARELLCLLSKEMVQADDVRVGDIIDEGFGPILVAFIDRDADGSLGLLDSFRSGTYQRPDAWVERVVSDTLRTARVKELLEQQAMLMVGE
jgi:hypothetical protein